MLDAVHETFIDDAGIEHHHEKGADDHPEVQHVVRSCFDGVAPSRSYHARVDCETELLREQRREQIDVEGHKVLHERVSDLCFATRAS